MCGADGRAICAPAASLRAAGDATSTRTDDGVGNATDDVGRLGRRAVTGRAGRSAGPALVALNWRRATTSNPAASNIESVP